MAVAAPWPIHVALDSQTAHRGLCRVIESLRDEPPIDASELEITSRAFWAAIKPTAPDADLWSLVRGILRAKGSGSVRATW
eukprot:15107042-Alexandrium_andersonii.AAC.1